MKSNQIDKKIFKKDVSRLARALTVYEIILMLVAVVYIIIYTVYALLPQSPITSEADIMNALMSSGLSSILGCAAGLLLINRYRRKSQSPNAIMAQGKKMDAKSFLAILTVFMSTQLIFMLASWLGESALNFFGYTMQAEIDTATQTSTTFSMLIYVSLIGPIAEEFVFRGVALRALERYGKVFAIVVSAILFGCFHANLMQGMFAIIVGIILGYVTIEYSIRWAILLHIFNNFIFSQLLSLVTAALSPAMQDLIITGVMVLFFIGGMIILFKKRLAIKQYFADNRSGQHCYRYALTSCWMLIFIVLNLILAVSGITPK